MRLMVKPLKVLKIDAGAQGGFIEFSPSAKVDPEKFIKLIQQNPIVYRFDGPLKFKFRESTSRKQSAVRICDGFGEDAY